MIIKKPTRKIEFADQDEGFISQLTKDIGCYYHKANGRTYSLNQCDSDIRGEMAVFAWVHKTDKDYFWITTRRDWVEEAKTKALAGRKASELTCFPRDTQHAEDSVCFDTKDDYEKTVRILRLISKVH